MSFILHSNFFDIIISILIVLNVVFTIILSIGDLKKDLNKCNNNDKLTKIQLFKLIVIIIYVVVLAIIVMKIAKKYNIGSYLTLIYYASFVVAAIKLFNKNINDLTFRKQNDLYNGNNVIFNIFF